MNYNTFTKQGHEIKKIYKTLYPELRRNAIFKRVTMNDYNIALGYDIKDGTWAQGIYDFRSLDDAERYLRNYLNRNNIIYVEEKKTEV